MEGVLSMTSLLILTVGTGTAGKNSDVAQGLANTIRQVRPRRFWLVPSTSETSTPVAEWRPIIQDDVHEHRHDLQFKMLA